MHWSQVVTATCFLLLCAGLTVEFFRFQDALNVAEAEHESFRHALNGTACAKDFSVVSIEWRGQVLDCNLARHVLQRSARKSAFILWWNSSAWVALWQRVAHNALILTLLAAVGIVALVGFSVNALQQVHFVNSFKRIQRRQQQPLALPSTSERTRNAFQQPKPRRYVYHGADESEVD